jgi:hypothetical protein
MQLQKFQLLQKLRKIGMNNWKIELVCSASCRHFGSLLILLILDELETLLKQKDNESISKRGSESYSDGKGNNPSVDQHRVCLTFMLIGSDYIMSPWHRSAHDVNVLPANSHISRSPPQLLHAELSISEPTSSPEGLEMIRTACPSSLPGPELLRHLYVVRFRSQQPALNARFAGLMFSLNSIHMRVACSMQHHS